MPEHSLRGWNRCFSDFFTKLSLRLEPLKSLSPLSSIAVKEYQWGFTPTRKFLLGFSNMLSEKNIAVYILIYHLIAALNSICIHLWCVTLLRDRMVWNVIWWNQLWVLYGTTHTHWNASAVWKPQWIWGWAWPCGSICQLRIFLAFLGPSEGSSFYWLRSSRLFFRSAKVLLNLLQFCLGDAASAGEGPSDLAKKRVRLVPLKSEFDKGWKTSDMKKRAVLRKICVMNGAPSACEKEYPVIKR